MALSAVIVVVLATERSDSETKREEFTHKKEAFTDKDGKSLILQTEETTMDPNA